RATSCGIFSNRNSKPWTRNQRIFLTQKLSLNRCASTAHIFRRTSSFLPSRATKDSGKRRIKVVKSSPTISLFSLTSSLPSFKTRRDLNRIPHVGPKKTGKSWRPLLGSKSTRNSTPYPGSTSLPRQQQQEHFQTRS